VHGSTNCGVPLSSPAWAATANTMAKLKLPTSWCTGDRGVDLRKFSYGATSAVVTGMALVTGLDAANSARLSIIAGLLIFAVADNLSDSLSIHVYQESERIEGRAAFRATLTNFATRLALALSFVLIVALTPAKIAVLAAIVWGSTILCVMTAILARNRGVPVASEVAKHLALAAVVIAASRGIGAWLLSAVG
jgi:VIT1/CCC1 family predicted Fe2+/Mn2+ transporter